MAAALSYTKPVVVEASEEATATVIWLHGLGDDGKEWERLAEKTAVPWAKFIMPNAPTHIRGRGGRRALRRLREQ